jgi:micrococcal nuclease
LPPRCELDGDRTYDRCVGICYLQGEEMSDIMVHRGLARDCPRFSRGRYAEAESQAAAAGAAIGRIYTLPEYCRPR